MKTKTLEKASHRAIQICCKGEGYDEIGGQMAEAIAVPRPSPRQRDYMIKTLIEHGFDRVDISDPNFIFPLQKPLDVILMYKLNGGKNPNLNFRDKDEIIRSVAKKYSGKDVGSGAGFGERDMQFEFEKDVFEKFKAELKKKIKGKFTVYFKTF